MLAALFSGSTMPQLVAHDMTQHIARINYMVPVIFGFGTRALLTHELAAVNALNPFIVSDRGVVGAGLLEKITPYLPKRFDVFLDTELNPTEAAACRGVLAYRNGRHDCILGLGGGAAMDLAKAIAILVHNPAPLWHYSNRYSSPKPYHDIPPLWLLPTTAGTGSEVGRSAVIVFDNGIKAGIRCPDITKAAICDPDLSLSLPPRMTAATGLDAISHAIETFCSPTINPPADAIAADALQRLLTYLPIAVADGSDRVARWHCLMGSMQAALAFQKGLGAVHAMAHSLGALGFHHGSLNAILLPHVLRMNESSLGCKWGALSALCAGDDTAYGLDIIDNRSASHEHVGLPDPADRVEALNEQLGLPRRLSELGVDYKDLESISNASVQDQANRSNPKTMSALDYLKILKQAY